MKNSHQYLTGMASTIAICMAMSPVYAQDTAAENEARQEGLEEIVVTARKRSENMQDVAISVSAMSASEIERQFSSDIRDLAGISPNLIIDDTSQGPGGVASIFIRGVGVSEVEKSFDPAVGVVVDGIFLGQLSGGITRSIDLESVEILRGPQGTVFGRNTIGGVVKIERSKPTGELGAKIRASYGNYKTLMLDSVVNFGVTEKIAVKLTGSYNKQGKGFYNNLATGRDAGRSEYTNFGANVLFSPSDDVELEYTFVTERTTQDTPPLLNVGQPGQLFCDAFGYCSPDIHTPITGDRYTVTMKDDDVGLDAATFDADTHIIEARWDINDDFKFNYIFGSWKTAETIRGDWDGTPELLFHTDRPGDYAQTSHEVRVAYDADGPFSGVFGAYLWDSNYEARLRSYIGFAIPDVVLDLPQTTNQTTDSWAIFFEGDYALSDALKLTLGARFSRDEKTTDQVGIVNAAADHSWKKFTPKVALTYALDDDSMVYASYSQGYRSGGFNGRVDDKVTAETPYDEEVVDNFEAGFKSTLLDNTLRLNGAVFVMKYKDKQEEIQLPSETSGTGQVTLVANASTATIKGIELDAQYVPMAGLTIRANLGLLKTDYDTFVFDGGLGLVDYSHLDFRRSPKVSANLGANYDWDIGEGVATVGGSWHLIGAYQTDFFNEVWLNNDSAQNLVDANIGYTINNVQINLYARNIFKEDGYTIGYKVANLWSYAATRAPRTFGVELNYRF